MPDRRAATANVYVDGVLVGTTDDHGRIVGVETYSVTIDDPIVDQMSHVLHCTEEGCDWHHTGLDVDLSEVLRARHVAYRHGDDPIGLENLDGTVQYVAPVHNFTLTPGQMGDYPSWTDAANAALDRHREAHQFQAGITNPTLCVVEVQNEPGRWGACGLAAGSHLTAEEQARADLRDVVPTITQAIERLDQVMRSSMTTIEQGIAALAAMSRALDESKYDQ